MNHLTEEQLVLHYYSDAADEIAIEEHLAQCPSCHSGYQELQRALALLVADPVPERTEEYCDRVWRRLRPQLRRRRTFNWAVFMPRPSWAFSVVIAAALVGAFLLGRYWPQKHLELVVQTPTAVVRERVLLAALSEHLERSQMALTELSHARGDGEVDMSAEQTWAHEILEENTILRQNALRAGEPGIVDLLEDLERILLEVENSPSRISGADLNRIQQRMESVGILFKMKVIESRLRQEQRTAARAQARLSS